MKYTLITGVTSGIGYYLAHECARVNMPLILVSRDVHQLNSVADELRGTYNIDVHTITVDLSEQNAAEYVFKKVQESGYEVSYLINNAGIGDFAYFADSDARKIEQMITLNVNTLTMLTRYFLPSIVAQKGKIMNLASTAAFQPGPTMAVYYATKAYVLSFSEALQEELRGTGVTVTALCPGPTQSSFQKTAHLEESKLVKNRKLPTAEEVAQYGFKKMIEGKSVAIHGWMNFLVAQSVRFSPRALVVRLVHFLQKK